ncbi:MAG: GAF domain-containing protein [Alicyclobacillus mali]|uniref:sensor histidine kinase n=1 Tax=Alicyclobacillus mali (ex Roth et al. 2021) TaxID=1123961 RepID=UPI0023F001CF|nr:histidine kinase [Alicyclobacillus mali (ex Roth et al. 2021)]MCL6489767.1 GAF domain-containing protein [Alicyclobacillus mali (ex Roth et al. 2021)]
MSSSLEQELLSEISKELACGGRVDKALPRVLARLAALLGLKAAWAFAYDHRRRTYRLIATTGLPPALGQRECHALRGGWCECQDQFDAGNMREAITIVRCSRLERARGDKEGLAYHASVPLASDSARLGVMNIAAQDREYFSPETLRVLSTVGAHLATAMEREWHAVLAERHVACLRELIALGQYMATADREARLFRITADAAVKLIGCEGAAVIASTGERLAAAKSETRSPRMYTYWPTEMVKQIRSSIRPVALLRAGDQIEAAISSEAKIVAEDSTIGRFDETDQCILEAIALMARQALVALDTRRRHAEWRAVSERQTIASHLHDSVNQRLFSAAMFTHAAQAEIERDPHKAVRYLTKIQILIDDARQELRQLASTLRHTDAPSVSDTMRRVARDLADLPGLTVHIRAMAPDADTCLRPSARAALCRAIDEAVQNALRHGAPSRLEMALLVDDERILFRLIDDGRGFDPARADAGFGLASIRQQIEAEGGGVRWVSKPGQGAQFEAWLPQHGWNQHE